MAGQHGRRQSTSIHPSIDRRDIADSLGVTLSKVPSRPSDSHTSTSEIMRSSLKPAPSFPITSSGRYQIPTNLANKTGRIEAPAGPRRDEVLRNSSEPESVVEVAAISSRDYEATTSLHVRPSKTLSEHRSPSTNSIRQQTIIKSLASLPSPHQPQLGSNGAQRSNLQSPPPVQHQGGASPQNLSDALSSLQLNSPNHIRERLVSPVRNSAVTSPCFFHQRLDDAVDLDRALEEIVDDEWMSHSKLMQTATGVREVSKQLQRRPIKRAVRNVMIVTKARDNQLVTLTRQLASWLLTEPRYGSDLGVNVYVDAKLRNSKRFDAAGLLECEPRFGSMLQYWTPELCRSQPENFDLVLTLGGDGTVLFTSWLFQRIVPPILSFSLGSLGFLTNFEFSQYKTHLNRVMGESGMRVSLRMRFTCTIFRNGSIRAGVISEVVEAEQFEVLNELVIDRGPSPYVSNLELFGDGELLTVVQADGCIFSTPTGIHLSLLHRPSTLSLTDSIVVKQDQQPTRFPPADPSYIQTSPPSYSRLSVPIHSPSGQCF